MGTAASSCKDCFGDHRTESSLSSRSSLGLSTWKQKIMRDRERETSLGKGDKPDARLKHAQTVSEDHILEREDSVYEKNPQLTIDDFKIMKTLGEGSFGKVYLVQRKSNKKLYALKSIKKKDLMLKNLHKLVLNEKNILKDLKHPFVIQLKYSFQSKTRIYLVTEYCQGGDLTFWMKQEGKFDEKTVRFYAAEMILALQYLHDNLNLIHRDIKPDNMLIAADGHLKITDFGLAKSTTTAITLCGTPDFLAPEIILGRPYGKEVDWWSLGCLLYEMLTGHATFHGNRDTLILSIIKEKPKMKENFSEPLKDLLIQLLEKNPKKRLGYRGAAEVKKHPFFQGVDWEAVRMKQAPPPFGKMVLKQSITLQEGDTPGSLVEQSGDKTAKDQTDGMYYSQFSDFGKDTMIDSLQTIVPKN